MCLAVPMELITIDGNRGTVRAPDVELEISLELVDEPAVGDFMIVHAGYAIQKLGAEEAKETLAIFEKFMPHMLGRDGA